MNFLLFLFFVIIAIDAFPQFYTWQSRIKIGQFANQEDWKNKVLEISKKWLFKTPTITITDNKRLIIIDILKGNYKKSAIQHWQEAALLLGLIQEYKSSKSETTKVIISNYVDSKIDSYGNWKSLPTEIDSVILAYALISIPWMDVQKNKNVFTHAYNIINSLKGEDGTIGYKKHTTNFRYVDTIGFICPFLIEFGQKFNQPEAIDLAVKQIEEFNKFGLLNDTFIPCHTYNINSKLPVGLFGWGRGLGWYAIGLIDSWNALPNQSLHKITLEKSVLSFAKMALQFQNNNGSWSWIVTNNEVTSDSSTTATLAWFLANASSIESISKECIDAKEKALHYLQKVTRRKGEIDFSQGDTKAIGVHSQNFDILPFTQGFALRTLYF